MKKLVAVMALAGLSTSVLAGALQGVAIRADGNVLRLQVESEQGTLRESGVTPEGRQLVVSLKGVSAEQARKLISDKLGQSVKAVKQVKVVADGRDDSRLLIDLTESFDLLDETIAAVGGKVSQWELVLARRAVKDELASVDLNIKDGEIAVLLRGGKELQAQPQLLSKPQRLVIDFPKLSKAHLQEAFKGVTVDPQVFSSLEFLPLTKAGGTRVSLAFKERRNLVLAEPGVNRSETGTAVLLAVAPPPPPAAPPAPVVVPEPVPERVAQLEPPKPEPVPEKPVVATDKGREPMGTLREVSPIALAGAVEATQRSGAEPQTIGMMDLFTKGLESDPKYRAAKADYLANAEAKAQALAGYLPTAAYDFQRTQQNQTINSSNIAAYQSLQGQTQRYPVTSHTLTINQPIIKAASWVQMEQAKVSVEQSRLLLVAAEQDLILRSATAYLNMMAAQDGVELARSEREASEKQAQQAKVRYDSGLGTVTQFHETQGRLAVNQARELDATNKLDDARGALREIVGFDVTSLQPFAGDIEPSVPQPMQVDPWVAAALEQNLALQARLMAKNIASLEVRRQQAGYLPTVNFTASYSKEDSGGSLFRDTTGKDMGKSNISNMQFGVRLNMPLFEGGMTNSLVREAAAKMSKSEEEYEQELRKTERQASAAVRGLLTSAQTMTALRKSLVAQESALEAKEEGMRTGLYSIVQVVDAQRLYYTAKRDYLQARYDYLLNRLKLKQAVGSLSRTDLEDLAALLK
ncbi:TolC family outer membrane protein [Aquabacterium sp.]|uniref:TolC family outer membrane protein n=1 Tax=Aquabacterium sp. TaxID=1872578 RepID=UPI003BF5B9C3